MSDDLTQQLPHHDLRVQVLDLNTRLAAVEEKVDRKLMETQPIWSEFANQLAIVGAQLVAMDQRIALRFDAVDLRLDRVESRLEAVEMRLDRVETRLENVEIRLDKVETRLENVEIRLDKVEVRLGKVEYELYGLGKKFRVLNREILDMQNAHEDLDERVSTIENPDGQQNER